ncbi:hypothetical protein DUNSADRAFT_5836 [Dunaliella salina]|uniref:Uncharacterized protein n=1 Tax=Dunaliella salina TaxID=3046 RepID=A0ABQ7FU29_DUNSA|nr:hypothetical protein DUNSADRAFT_5836 [Dunaliella salina]|eukprot:KAF5825934.1 hypothetical protein DUNSADRAFT_5836 [Dunaliella salina]
MQEASATLHPLAYVQGPSSAELAAMPTLASAVAGEAQPSAGPGTASSAQGDMAGGIGGSGLGIALDPQQQGRLAREEAAAAARALGFASADDLEASVALQASLDEKKDQPQPSSSPPPSGSGAPSFAQLARMGFAATGPALGSSPPSSGAALQAQVRN